MHFDEFIEDLNSNDKRNYLKYSNVRGVQIYRVIYKTLSNVSNNITYKDVNAFVRYDKAIKDVLYKYLGTLEDLIRKDIFMKFDLKTNVNYKERYLFFKDIEDLVINVDNSNNGITELYSRWALMFNDTIQFLKKYNEDAFNITKLEKIRLLRNDVMHHSSLLFSIDGKSKINELNDKIICLIETLPKEYVGLSKELNSKTNSVKRNINNEYECLLLKEF